MPDLPSKTRLRNIGKALVAGTMSAADEEALDAYLLHCDDVQDRARARLDEALAGVWLANGGEFSVQGRAKTLITLREKLERLSGDMLPRIRDVAGLRIVADMYLHEQDEVLAAALAALGVVEHRVIDRRIEPSFGYRALHAEFQLDGVYVELQIRTSLQALWANVYERLADAFGREIRYKPVEELTPEVGAVVKSLRGFADALYEHETERQQVYLQFQQLRSAQHTLFVHLVEISHVVDQAVDAIRRGEPLT